MHTMAVLHCKDNQPRGVRDTDGGVSCLGNGGVVHANEVGSLNQGWHRTVVWCTHVMATRTPNASG
jgi:hypothetical protein